tara:strand:+ start:14449 stop:15150 length:702 start_codon:yes stop_codon:yes gene_type:complete
MDKNSSEPNESPKDLSIGILGTELYETPEGESGQALVINSTRGEIPCLFHEAENEQLGIVWVGGARGGFTGPAGGIYKKFSDSLTSKGISSLRLHYRQPNNLEECVLDTLAGVGLLEFLGIKQIILIGHSFGGAVVISAAPLSESTVGVVAMSSQTYGASRAGDISPRKLLLIHGLNDTRLGPHCSEFIFEWANEPKKIILLEGGGHGLSEVIEDVEEALEIWLNEFITKYIN